MMSGARLNPITFHNFAQPRPKWPFRNIGPPHNHRVNLSVIPTRGLVPFGKLISPVSTTIPPYHNALAVPQVNTTSQGLQILRRASGRRVGPSIATTETQARFPVPFNCFSTILFAHPSETSLEMPYVQSPCCNIFDDDSCMNHSSPLAFVARGIRKADGS